MALKLLTYFGKKSKAFLLGIAITLVLIVGYIDYLTGVALSLAVFYLLPVALVAWFSSQWSAYSISVLGAVAWFFVDLLKTNGHLSPFIPYWNAAVRLGIFLIVAFVLAKLKLSIESELKLAAEIQQRFLPDHIPHAPGVEISVSMKPSHAVSGDYFDVIKYSDTEMGFCIADVVGHGVPAAILMSNLQAAVKIYASNKTMPKDLCQKLNQTITNNTLPGKFITFFYGLLDIQRNKLVYANAGHNPPVLLRKDGSCILLDESDLVLGVLEEATYCETELKFEPGDRLILFTDGVTELRNPLGQQFEVDRLINVIQKNSHLTAVELRDAILNELTRFGLGIFPDDITMLIIIFKEGKITNHKSQATAEGGELLWQSTSVHS